MLRIHLRWTGENIWFHAMAHSHDTNGPISSPRSHGIHTSFLSPPTTLPLHRQISPSRYKDLSLDDFLDLLLVLLFPFGVRTRRLFRTLLVRVRDALSTLRLMSRVDDDAAAAALSPLSEAAVDPKKFTMGECCTSAKRNFWRDCAWRRSSFAPRN